MFLKTYQKYILQNYLITLLTVFIIFFSLILVLNIFEEISFFKDADINFLYPLFLTFLNTPSVIYDIFPFIFLITSQFFFIKIIEKNELNILKNYGLNNFKILRFVIFISFVLGILISLLFYNFSSKLKFLYLELKNNYAKDNKYLAVITENGLWIKDEIDNKINFVNAYEIVDNNLKKLTITQFTKDFKLIQYIEAGEANVTNNKWILKDAKISKLNIEVIKKKELMFNTNFNSDKIKNLFSNLSAQTFWELQDLKKNYKSIGYSTTEIDVHRQKIYSYPVYLMVMTMMSAIIMLNIKQNKPKIFHLIVGILLSVFIYYINFFANILGQNDRIPVTVSIWIPLIILTLLSSIGLVRINEK